MSTYEQRPTGWTFRYRDSNGRHRRSSGHASLKAAKAARRAILRDIDDGIALDKDMTFSMLVDEYLGVHHAADATLERIGQALAPAVEMFGNVPIVDLTGRRIRGLSSSGLTEMQRWMTLRGVKQVLKYAADEDMIRKNPASSIPNPQPKGKEAKPFTDWAEVMRVEALMPEWCRGLVVFMVGTGMRPQEWPKLRWEHVDLDARVLRLPAQIVKTKTPARNVPLRKIVVDLLASRQQASGPVWTGRDGEAFDNNEMRYWRRYVWDAALKGAELEVRRPYDCRHTYATWALRAGQNTFTLARRMGTSLAMIDKTYGHFAQDGEDNERFMLDAFDELASLGTDLGTRGGDTEAIGSSALPILTVHDRDFMPGNRP